MVVKIASQHVKSGISTVQTYDPDGSECVRAWTESQSGGHGWDRRPKL